MTQPPVRLLPPQRAHFHPLWLARLAWLWGEANRVRLGGALQPAVLTIDTQSHAVLGRWERRFRQISISEAHILTHPWHEVEQTLYHEMAHQYADEVLQAVDETAHGPAFVHACKRLRVEARARMHGGPAQESADRVLAKVKKLLALAESQNAHEAEVAMAAANRLLLQHNLDVAQAQGQRDYRAQRVGPLYKAVPVAAKLVSTILTQYFFVEAIWTSEYVALQDDTQRRLELLGSETNLQLASYVHDFLHHAVQRLWREAQHRHAGRSARRDFEAGVLFGFRDKLAAERKVSQEKGLVWIGDAGLDAFVAQEHPNLRTMARASVGRSSALSAGRAAGAELRLHQGVTHHGSGGKLLTNK